MNFLAHLYLSGDSADVRMGNFIADSVKGSQFTHFRPEVQKGILMHRHIDTFTDSHLIVKEAVGLLRPVYGRYAMVVSDVFFDHFLAANWASYSQQPLGDYVSEVHRQLLQRYFQLPSEVKRFLPFMIKSRRLENYRHLDSLERALEIMSNHSTLPPMSRQAIVNLEENYQQYGDLFASFFVELQIFVADFNR